MEWTLVTGGAKGLGAELCRSLACEGHSVLVHYRSSEREAARVAEECQSLGGAARIIQADFSSPKGVDSLLKMIDQKGLRIANLVNNVGNFLERSALETSWEEWNGLFQVNLHAPFLLIKGVVPGIKAARGSIINIGLAGMAGSRANCRFTAHSITKHSLYLLTKSLARELAGDLVRVNMVSPGEMENSVSLRKDPQLLPMKRAASLSEAARAVLFLMKEENAYITGQNLEVAGGYAL